MVKRLALLLLIAGTAACGSSLPSAPSRIDLTRCVGGAGASGCLSASRRHGERIVTAASVGAPSGLSATVTGDVVTLTWTAPAPSNDIDGVYGYIIDAGSAPGRQDVIELFVGTQTSYTARGVGAGRYFVRVRTRGFFNSGDLSAPSNEVLVVVGTSTCTPPASPSGLAPISIRGGTVTLAWNTSPGGPTSYVLEAGSGPGLSDLANADLRSLLTGLTVTGVSVGTYYVRIRAINACGLSAPSNEIIVVVG
jgi:hypothetical protein